VPAVHEIDVGRHLVRTTEWGELSDDDLRRLYDRIRDDPAFDPSFRQLCDLRTVTKITTSVDTLRSLAQTSIFLPGARRAFVVGREVDFGLARLFQTYSEVEGGTVEVFRNMADAEAWLGLTKETGPDR
jgi:hypothetical protein